MNTQRLLTTMVASILLAGGALGEAVMHGRISAETGGALIRGSEDADWSYATVNTLVLPGDTLWADERGAVEMELYGGTFIRFADQSKAEIASVPPEALIRGWSGSFYVQRLARSTGNVALSTPAATIRIDKDSMVRVDIVGEGSTTVSVRWGGATVETVSGRPVMLGRNQRTYIDPGLLPSTPSYFDTTVEDDFDLWNRAQARLLALGEESFQAPVQETAPPVGATSLAGYGEWVTIDSQPYWRPTVVVDFVPYRVGYWSYVPRHGHVWVGGYPFSYVTSHYGRWIRHPRYGWCWTYRSGWSPAWVASYRYGPNYIWAPLDIYDRPVTYGEAHFRIGDMSISIATSSYCSVNDLAWGPAIVHPVQPQIVNVNVVNQEIHVWNLGNQYRVPSVVRPQGDGRPVLQVRDYNPQRVIRGPEAGGGQGLVARARASALEQTSVRNPFRAAAAPGSRGVRTSVNSGTRNAQLRSTRLAPEARQQAATAVQRIERGDVGIRARSDAAPGRDDRITTERTLGNIRSERSPDSERVTRRTMDPLTPSDVGGGDRVTRRTDGVDRTPRTVTPDRGSAQDRLGSGRGAAGGDRTPTRVQTPSRTPAPSREAGPDRTRTPDRTPAPTRRPESVRQTPNPAPQQATPRSTRTPVTVRQTPAPAPQRVQPRSAQPTPAPRATTWQRPSAPSQSATPQVRAPQASRNAAPTRVAPRTAPSSPPRVAQPSPPASRPQVQAPSPRPNRSAAPAPARPNTGSPGAAGNRARGR